MTTPTKPKRYTATVKFPEWICEYFKNTDVSQSGSLYVRNYQEAITIGMADLQGQQVKFNGVTNLYLESVFPYPIFCWHRDWLTDIKEVVEEEATRLIPYCGKCGQPIVREKVDMADPPVDWDALARRVEAGEDIRVWVRDHPDQPWSRKYFASLFYGDFLVFAGGQTRWVAISHKLDFEKWIYCRLWKEGDK